MDTWRQRVDFVTSLVLLAVALILLYLLLQFRWQRSLGSNQAVRSQAPTEVQVPSGPIDVSGVAALGSAAAPVALVAFSDFQCPWCATFATSVFPAVVREFVDTGRVRFLFFHLPIEAIHPQAKAAAIAAECAGDQGRFWDAHDQFFRDTRAVSAGNWAVQLAGLGLDQAPFLRCMEGAKAQKVQAQIDFARSLGISGTPTFIVGRIRGRDVIAKEVLRGAQPVVRFRQALEQALGAASGLK